ncbi:hypothetical protein [Rhodococcus sp. ACT016]|uniref:hypothetical protein n=1 Tax=Rhodococcus sp. ACT016 TaxID=3134808 RepID=UPI003D2C8DD7
MGAWASAPWHNDAAADWFGDVFAGIDIDARIGDALEYDDDYDRVRAACYLLAVLRHSTVWPGDLERLDGHLERGVEMLTDMIEPSRSRSSVSSGKTTRRSSRPFAGRSRNSRLASTARATKTTRTSWCGTRRC